MMQMTGPMVMNKGASGPPARGEPWQGGFYIGTNKGYHFVIADKADEVELKFGFNTETGAVASSGPIYYNWNILKTSYSDSNYPAIKYVVDYRGGGYDDWMLVPLWYINAILGTLVPGRADTGRLFDTGGEQATVLNGYYLTSQETSKTRMVAVQTNPIGSTQQNYSKSTPAWIRPYRVIPE